MALRLEIDIAPCTLLNLVYAGSIQMPFFDQLRLEHQIAFFTPEMLLTQVGVAHLGVFEVLIADGAILGSVDAGIVGEEFGRLVDGVRTVERKVTVLAEEVTRREVLVGFREDGGREGDVAKRARCTIVARSLRHHHRGSLILKL